MDMSEKEGEGLEIKVNHEEAREDAAKRFVNRLDKQRKVENFWKILTFTAIVAGFGGNALLSMTMLQEIKKPQMVAILDESKNIVVTPLESLETSIEIEQYCSELCAIAILSRNWQLPYNFPEMLPRLFAPDLVEEIVREGSVWKKEAGPAQLNWSPIPVKFTPHSNKDGSIIITKLEGRLTETGVFGGVLEEKTSSFVLGLKLAQNPRIGERGRFPWVCVSYNLTIR